MVALDGLDVRVCVHGFILARGSDIWGSYRPLLSNGWVTKKPGPKSCWGATTFSLDTDLTVLSVDQLRDLATGVALADYLLNLVYVHGFSLAWGADNGNP